jgi:hypothetical protein
MDNGLLKIPNNVQDKNTEAWYRLYEYVEQVYEEELEEFHPSKVLGRELYHQIFTLPDSIAKLKKVKVFHLYGSKLKRIPTAIGQMEGLEKFIPYTSYDLHWFPYEITYCKNIKDSIVSTRAIYGNYKGTMMFPSLEGNPVRYHTPTIRCSHCRKEMPQEETDQYWISLVVGTDVLPLLVNVCSEECRNNLPTPPTNYFQYPHKGGVEMGLPTITSRDCYNAVKKYWTKE